MYQNSIQFGLFLQLKSSLAFWIYELLETLGLDANAWLKTWACTTLKQPYRLTNSFGGCFSPIKHSCEVHIHSASSQSAPSRSVQTEDVKTRFDDFVSLSRVTQAWQMTVSALWCQMMECKTNTRGISCSISSPSVMYFYEQHLLHPFWCVSITGSIKQSKKEPADTNGPTFSYFPKPDTWQIWRVFMG